MKARNEGELAIGWHSERFAREKQLKPIDKYLKPAPAVDRREKGARDLKRMFDRMIKKQEAANGDR